MEMFEKATVISAIFVLIVFGIVSTKYYQFLERKNQSLVFPSNFNGKLA
jgi:hypothetical protein